MAKTKKSKNAYGMKLPKNTESLCPECQKKIPARVFEKGGKVMIEKTCDKHGKFSEFYFGDAKTYNRFRKFNPDIQGPENRNLISRNGCPFDCGLCENHKSSTLLANMVLTNRCDLRCWYCFYYAKEGENVYEPTLEQIEDMLKTARKQRPVAPIAIQLTGGNPELRNDLLDIVRMCKKEGFIHIQLNTQGTHRLWKDPNFMKKLSAAGVNTIYLSFDGTTKKTNTKNHWEVPYILKNAKSANIAVVLVPTIIKGVNDHEIANIINFALNNLDVVRGVNFQPVSLVGRMPKTKREEQRITIPEVLDQLEDQSRGTIKKTDFYPVPCTEPISRFIGSMSGQPQYHFSSHFACGAGTYIFLCGKRIVPITKFIDVEGFFKFLDKLSVSMEHGANKELTTVKAFIGVKKFIDESKEPKKLNLYRLLYQVFMRHDYEALGKFHQRSLFIGTMHFMDLYNYDIERVQRCCIHYLMPDKRVVPFCTFNVIPSLYRDEVQKKFSIPSGFWEKKNKQKLRDDIYKRDIKRLENGKPYKDAYENIIDYFETTKKFDGVGRDRSKTKKRSITLPMSKRKIRF